MMARGRLQWHEAVYNGTRPDYNGTRPVHKAARGRITLITGCARASMRGCVCGARWGCGVGEGRAVDEARVPGQAGRRIREARGVRAGLGKRWAMGMALCHLDVNIVRVAKAHGDGVVVNEKDAQHALDVVHANPQRVAHVVHAMLHEQVRVVAHVLVADVVKRRAASSAAEDARVPHFAACSGRRQWVIPQWRAAVPRAKRPPCRRFARVNASLLALASLRNLALVARLHPM